MTSLEVKPKEWLLPNRIGYNKKIYNEFNISHYPSKKKSRGCKCTEDVCEEEEDVISLFPQQRIIRDYMQSNSPYRGVLLYHELGSGKSAASIAASEEYVGKKKIFVLTPASLAQNYENELMKISKTGKNLKKKWILLKLKNKTNRSKETVKTLLEYGIKENIIKKDNLVWIPLYNNDIPEEEGTLITDMTEYKYLNKEHKNSVDNMIFHIIRNKYNFISYNGLTQKLIKELGKNPFDNSFVIVDEIHNLISRIVNGSKLARNIYNSLMIAENCKLVLLSGTPIINNPYEIATLINLLRGPMNIYRLSLLKNSIEPTNDILKDTLIKSKDNLYNFIDEIFYDDNDNYINLILLPNGFKRKDMNMNEITKIEWKMTRLKLLESIIKELNKVNNLKISVKHNMISNYALSNNKDEFNKFFINDKDIENPVVINEDLFKRRILGSLSYYRTTGTELFPTVLPNSIEYLDMTNHQLNLYSDVRNKERSMDNNKGGKGGKGVLDDKSSVYRAFSRMVCNFAFPEEIKRNFPHDIKKALNKELSTNNEYGTSSSGSSTSSSDAITDNKGRQKMITNAYEEDLNNALEKLNDKDKNYLSKDNLKNLYSPKFYKMLIDVEQSPGSVLIYSQFRTIEGIGIFSNVLDHNGFIEIKLVKHNNDYIFEDLSVFDKKYDNKRYVVFNTDRIKTNILMNLFNGAFTLLPESIKEQLDTIDNDKNQLYGKLVKIMMITQSGAEGISLKNVRRVLITEYFWNSVRINQVIGRAVRTCSHEQLPKKDQNVQIFTYIMKFTKKQLENNFTLRTLDKEKTTDQHILNIATKKEDIINKFLNMLKSASFDCVINSLQNKPSENGYKCYNWPINVNTNELSYTPNIIKDNTILNYQKYQVSKNNKGTVISKNGNKYILLDNKVYDYFNYKNANILLPVDIKKL